MQIQLMKNPWKSKEIRKESERNQKGIVYNISSSFPILSLLILLNRLSKRMCNADH